MEEKARALIDDLLRPLIEADGGTIDLVECRDKKLVIRLAGTCAGCPGKDYTVGRVIEPAVKHALGKDVDVEVV